MMFCMEKVSMKQKKIKFFKNAIAILLQDVDFASRGRLEIALLLFARLAD